MNKRLTLLLLICTFSVNAQYGPVLNKDGSFVNGVLTASFDPQGTFSAMAVFPTPSSLAMTTTTDFTLDIPVVDPSDTGDPLVALSALDGWSTTEKWVTGFVWNDAGDYDNAIPGSVDPASVVPGSSVRVFEVTTTLQFVVVTSIVRELTPWVDYVAVAITDSQIAIIPTRPLKEYTSYMAVVTNGIRDTRGNDATPDRTYGLGKTSRPWIDGNGQSTYKDIFNDAQAQGLEQIRGIVQSMELNLAAFGLNPDDIVLAWTAKTQSITPTLKTLRALMEPSPTTIASARMDTSAFGLPGIADIYMGIITLPYYAGVPSAENPIAPLTDNWNAAPGAYVPPFDQFGLDPTSTHITIANPIPLVTSMQTVPLFMTVPNAKSGQSKPASGWPVVIFGHGIFGNRVQALAIADTMASIGYAVVAMDFPMHGISPDAEPSLAPFWVENTVFAPFANERTFDADYINNETLAPGPDGLIDPSGVLVIPTGLSSMLTGRDTLRQGEIDLSQLASAIPAMDIDGDSVADLNASNVAYVGISWGGIHGTVFTALEPMVTRSFLSVPGGGFARFANASDSFGPLIKGLLFNAAGLVPGTAEFEQFLLAWQTTLDSADPINWAAAAAANTPIMLHEVIGDTVIPNFVLTAPLSGTEPLIAAMGLEAYSTSQQSAEGLRSAARFVPPATHGQLGSPTSGSPAAFLEMQTQMATFIASHGGAIVVTDESTMVPVVPMEVLPVTDLTINRGAKPGNGKNHTLMVDGLEGETRLGRPDRFK